ncbi:MAG: hypothetical protein HF981_13780 [Desulfobacteraceae bacterium]|nr:hypothetical protein [Desulfobacteraceae bacterium]MBC2751452.1 hypothetical protein [Desulfobacteraceae bacterium]
MRKCVVIMFLLIISSCLSTTDVTYDQNFNYDYQKGQVYRTKIVLYVIEGSQVYLAEPGNYSPELENYLKNKKKYPDIKGIVKDNEKIVIEKITYRKTFESSYIDVFAKILSGNFKGEHVRLNNISNYQFKPFPQGGHIPTINYKILEQIK